MYHVYSVCDSPERGGARQGHAVVFTRALHLTFWHISADKSWFPISQSAISALKEMKKVIAEEEKEKKKKKLKKKKT